MSGTALRTGRLALLLAAIVVGPIALPVTASAAPPLRIVDLGIGDDSWANAINEQGHVVGSHADRPFLWRDGDVTYLDAPGGWGVAVDVNDRDEVVGYAGVGADTHAVLWRNGVMIDLGVLPGGTNSYASGINNTGEVVGWSATAPDNQGLHAFRWRDGVMTDLGVAPGQWTSVARDVNDDGLIVGEVDSLAAIWRGGGAARLVTAEASSAEAVNQRGHVTGLSWEGGTTHGFLWYRGRFTAIEPPPGAGFIHPHGINDDVQIVGHAGADAFVWQRGRTTILPGPHGTASANDINDNGQIVGFSTDPVEPRMRAVLWTR